MTATEDIRDIFSILHDGTISAWSGDKNLLTLTIDCEYLAERIDKSFDKFYVELFKIDKIELYLWSNQVNSPTVIKTDLADIFNADFEILSADIKDDSVVISCNQNNTDFDYCGGNLTISCQVVKVLDQNKNELAIDQLANLSKSYWEERSEK